MGHHCDYKVKVEYDFIHEGLALVYTAYWKDKHATVYVEHEDGSCFGRYLYFNCLAGYLVTFPGEKLRGYYGTDIQEEHEEFDEYCKCNLFAEWEDKEGDIEEIVKEHPEYKYFFQSFKGSLIQLLKCARNWKKDISVEFLMKNGFTELASSKWIKKLSSTQKRKLVDVLKKQEVKKDISPVVARILINENCSLEDALITTYTYNGSYKKYLYLKDADKKFEMRYQEYIKLVKKIKKKDDYWLYPKKEKLSEMTLRANTILLNIEKAKEEKRKLKFAEVVKKYLKFNNNNFNGLSIYVASDVDDVKEQAEELNQCLITNDYISKVIEKESLLVFVKKAEKRIATYELNPMKKFEIVQFYANEKSSNIKPSVEIDLLVREWQKNMVKHLLTIC